MLEELSKEIEALRVYASNLSNTNISEKQEVARALLVIRTRIVTLIGAKVSTLSSGLSKIKEEIDTRIMNAKNKEQELIEYKRKNGIFEDRIQAFKDYIDLLERLKNILSSIDFSNIYSELLSTVSPEIVQEACEKNLGILSSIFIRTIDGKKVIDIEAINLVLSLYKEFNIDLNNPEYFSLLQDELLEGFTTLTNLDANILRRDVLVAQITLLEHPEFINSIKPGTLSPSKVTRKIAKEVFDKIPSSVVKEYFGSYDSFLSSVLTGIIKKPIDVNELKKVLEEVNNIISNLYNSVRLTGLDPGYSDEAVNIINNHFETLRAFFIMIGKAKVIEGFNPVYDYYTRINLTNPRDLDRDLNDSVTEQYLPFNRNDYYIRYELSLLILQTLYNLKLLDNVQEADLSSQLTDILIKANTDSQINIAQSIEDSFQPLVSDVNQVLDSLPSLEHLEEQVLSPNVSLEGQENNRTILLPISGDGIRNRRTVHRILSIQHHPVNNQQLVYATELLNSLVEQYGITENNPGIRI
jgi:hypothetical protein